MLLTHLKEHPAQLASTKLYRSIFLALSFWIESMDDPLSLSCAIPFFKQFLIRF